MDLFSDCHCWWKLDDDSEEFNDVYNEVNSSFHGKCYPDVSGEMSETGKLGKCFYFEGGVSDDYVKIHDCDGGNFPSGNWTIAFWLKDNGTAALGDNRRWISKRAGDSPYEGYEFMYRNTNKLKFRVITVDVDKSVESTTLFNDSSWHFVLGERDGSTIRLFVDGSQEGGDITGVTGSMNADDEAVCFGKHSFYYSYYSKGWLDQVMMWARKLSASEKRWLWNNGSGQPGLVSVPRPLVGGSLADGRKGMVA
jgi:hypothetical protein